MLAGLAVRMAPLGLPRAIVKYGGSALWAAMFYWLFAALWPRLQVARLALGTGVFTLAVELFKLVHAPALDAFRYTLAGKLLLGRVFSGWDIAVYWAAILLAAQADMVLQAPKARSIPALGAAQGAEEPTNKG